MLKSQAEKSIAETRKTNPIIKNKNKTFFNGEFLLNFTKFRIKKIDIASEIKTFNESKSFIICKLLDKRIFKCFLRIKKAYSNST